LVAREQRGKEIKRSGETSLRLLRGKVFAKRSLLVTPRSRVKKKKKKKKKRKKYPNPSVQRERGRKGEAGKKKKPLFESRIQPPGGGEFFNGSMCIQGGKKRNESRPIRNWGTTGRRGLASTHSLGSTN